MQTRLTNSIAQRAKARGVEGMTDYERSLANDLENTLRGTFSWLTDEAREGIIAREILRQSRIYPAVNELGALYLFDRMTELFSMEPQNAEEA